MRKIYLHKRFDSLNRMVNTDPDVINFYSKHKKNILYGKSFL